MKKIFLLEEVLTFVDGHVIGLVRINPLDTSCYLYQIANLIAGRVMDPFDLMMGAEPIKDLIKSQFPEITEWKLAPPEAGWLSLSADEMGEEVAFANTKAYVESLHKKYNRTTLELEGPDSIEESHFGTMIVEL